MTSSPTSPTSPTSLPAVTLRVPTDEDAHAWHRAFADAEVMEFLGGPAELSAYEEFTARQRMHDAQLGYCLWTVLGPTGEVLGFAGAQPWPRDRTWGPVGELEIGWRLGRAHWGRGYVAAAMRQALERLRAAGVRRVVAVIDEGNARSVAVAGRLGMTPEESFPLPTGTGRGRTYGLAL
ncbi:GNAT family N-acetyltransferase [Streptomyces antimicrobicus]|uniref:GNAT family N-acetyltransferase n=1 Tax=Streptomyces antimicrobicus TaxID=2883108 RepID=A0ABS8B7C4_9ACTN|nr:GNAT family N-acetyltransferase [Streptomyces antimicrobicus]MCB5180510.1 GNAT family N-acetyltransferase [Streptomyces antimicrobicus]